MINIFKLNSNLWVEIQFNSSVNKNSVNKNKQRLILKLFNDIELYHNY